MEKLGGELSKTGANEVAGECVETVLVVQGVEDKVILRAKTSWTIRPPISAPFLTPMPSCAGERAEPTRSPTLERATRPTKRYQESPIPRGRGSPFFLGTISAGDVMAVLKKLSIGAAAGASGWTYAVMKAIFLCNGDYSDRASQPFSAA